MLLNEQSKLNSTGAMGGIYPPVLSAPLNIEVMSGSTGYQASGSNVTKRLKDDEFLNHTTIVLNNKAQKVKEFLARKREREAST